MFTQLTEWIRRLLPGRSDRDLQSELQAHLALAEDEARRRGRPDDDAVRAVRLRAGGVAQTMDALRDQRRFPWLDDLTADIRYGVRTLRRNPGFALTAIVTLALGIGVNVGAFSFINGLLIRPLYHGADDVVEVHGRRASPLRVRDFSYPNYRDVQAGATGIFAHLAASTAEFVGLDVGDLPRRAYAAVVTANYFDVFGAAPPIGRSFTEAEEQPGAGIRVAVISHQLWEQLGSDPGTLGSLVRVNGEQFTVVGVASKGFSGTTIPGPEIWLPLGAPASADRQFDAREAHELSVVGRLRPGVAEEAAKVALRTLGLGLEEAFPSINAGYSVVMSKPDRNLMFLPSAGAGELAGIGLLLMLMPLIVLLVTCLNLANLLLARGHVRQQELSVRSSLGGGRSRIVRQLLTECLLLALVGGAIGLLLSSLTTGTLSASLRTVLPLAVSVPDVSLDWRVLLGTMALSLVATLIFGAGPALALTRRAAAVNLRQGTGVEGRGPGGVRFGRLLVVGQIALSVLLLASGGLFMMSVVKAASADPGFNLDGGVLVQVDPGLAGYDEARGREAHLKLVERLRTVPGVEALTIASGFAFSGFNDSREVAPFGTADTESMDAVFTVVGRDYARVLGLPQVAGRDFSEAEMLRGSRPRVAIIDDALAEGLWPGQNALGRMIQFVGAEGQEAKQPMEIVGIIPAVNHSLGDPRPAAHVYVPLGQHYESAMTVQFRVAGSEADRTMLDTITRAVRDIDERLPVVSVVTWRDHINSGLDVGIYRTGAKVFAAFGGIALLLAVLGVYGVKSYVVSSRMREFGIRIAIGAQPRALLWQVIQEGGRVTLIGIGIGLVLAILAGPFFQGILYGVNGAEPFVLVCAPLILLAASLLASVIPARRATRVDPTVALRSE